MSVFKERFTLLGVDHVRCDAPSQERLDGPRVNRSMEAEPVGKFNLQTFLDHGSRRGYVRLYDFTSGEAAWYQVRPAEATSEVG